MRGSSAHQAWRLRAHNTSCRFPPWVRSPRNGFPNGFTQRRSLRLPAQSTSNRDGRYIRSLVQLQIPAKICAVVIFAAGAICASGLVDHHWSWSDLYDRSDSANNDNLLPRGQTYIAGSRNGAQRRFSRNGVEEEHLAGEKARTDKETFDVNAASLSFKDQASSAWSQLLEGLEGAKSSVTSIEWSSIPDTITDLIVPDWIRLLPRYIRKLQHDLHMAPGSLADEIWQEAYDVELNPEIAWDAVVRVSNDICHEEQRFVRKRRQFTRVGLARYLGLPEAEVHPEDVPTIALCGSGGGLRALIAGTGSCLSAQNAGLFDCVTYTAGVSGSCWLQALYNSTLTNCRYDRLVEHIKARVGVHFAFPPAALALLTSAPTNKYLFRGMIEKLQADPEGAFGLVDIYGLLLAARLLVPRGELGINDKDLKISEQRAYVDSGRHPLPIYTAVRHEIPLQKATQDTENLGQAIEKVKEKAKEESWFQWFELTPYELWCEELHAGIPSWAIGRKFDKGRNLFGDNGLPSPQLKMPTLMGMWGSAFCATLNHYYKELRPITKGITGFVGLDSLIEDRSEDLVKVHPIEPAGIPNYVLGMKDQLPKTCPESIFSSSHLQLMDAGMSNNLPIYPLLRPGRDVDIVIAFDASAQIKSENWLSIVDGYARQRGIRGWPVGAGWKTSTAEIEANVQKVEQAVTVQEVANKANEARDERRERNNQEDDQTRELPSTSEELGYCTVWVGSTEERTSTEEPPPTKKVEADWELMQPNAGITVVYFPFLPNAKVAGVDPDTSDFMSTWNSIYTPEQVDQVVALARANFDEGRHQTKAAVRAVYERKKKSRQERERAAKEARRRRKMRLGILGKIGEGDHFS